MQPDFSSLFLTDKIKPLRFRLRAGPSAVHDVQFLSSYLHDARFTADSVSRRGKKLTIMLERDCWEFGYTKHTSSSELHTAKCRLTVTPISALRWEVSDVFARDRELWVESIYLGATHWEVPNASELILSAPNGGWRLAISIAENFGEVRLDDQETPYLYSIQNKSNEALNTKGQSF